eukprot:scaffold1869_cov163-Ochromonas_danica.AAC.41
MEVLSISQEVASHLLALHSLSPEHIAKMAKVFIKSLLTGEALTALDDSWKAPCDALGILLIEAVRTQSTEAQLKSLLSEHGISGEVADTITTAYSQYHDLLAKHLQKIGIHYCFLSLWYLIHLSCHVYLCLTYPPRHPASSFSGCGVAARLCHSVEDLR